MEVIFAHPKIRKFILSLETSVRAETDKMIDLLAARGHELRPPDSKSIGRGLFELRVIDNVHVRVIYMFANDRAVVLHAFVKKTEQLPRKDVAYAREVGKRVLGILH